MNGPDDDQEVIDKQKLRLTWAYGYGFLSLMFLAFVCGYFLGKYIFGFNETYSLILSLIIGITTIIIETTLFIIKMERIEAHERKIKKNKVE